MLHSPATWTSPALLTILGPVTASLDRLSNALAGRYRLERELGAGGMATVYVAHDARHDRRVALKVLRPELAAVIGAERFLREIKTTANLQHPHILPLFDSGEADTFLFYVMPLVEGESLRDRLDRERQLGVEESVRLAREVAAALDYAHRHGVVHRDIKPANILLHDGSALVSDFGIALAIRNAGADRITETGLSLGTPHYMSPEQATGDRDIGARSDIYSTAAVLYEMLAGEPPHAGGTIQAVIAKVLTETPKPLGSLRQSVPVHVALAVEQALSKVPADRFATAAEFADALTNPAMTMSRSRTMRAATTPPPPRLSWSLVGGICGALVVGAALGWVAHSRDHVARQPVVTFAIASDSSQVINDVPAISPDGSTLVYRVDGPGGGQLHVRRMGELESRLIPGTEDANTPFFSPDGASIAFQAGDALKKTRLDAGTPVVIAGTRGFFLGGTWRADNTIVYACWPNLGLFRVNANGGAPPQPIPIRDSTISPSYPSFLPDGKTILFTSVSNSSAEAAVATLDLVTGKTRTFGSGLSPQFVAPGTLVYASGSGTLMAQPFDPVSLDTVGPPVQVGTDVLVRNTVIPYLSVSQSGTVA